MLCSLVFIFSVVGSLGSSRIQFTLPDPARDATKTVASRRVGRRKLSINVYSGRGTLSCGAVASCCVIFRPVIRPPGFSCVHMLVHVRDLKGEVGRGRPMVHGRP